MSSECYFKITAKPKTIRLNINVCLKGRTMEMTTYHQDLCKVYQKTKEESPGHYWHYDESWSWTLVLSLVRPGWWHRSDWKELFYCCWDFISKLTRQLSSHAVPACRGSTVSITVHVTYFNPIHGKLHLIPHELGALWLL